MNDAQTGQAHSAHTTRPVPLVYVGPGAAAFAEGGTLADVAPTALALLGLPAPPEMTGRSLLRWGAAAAGERRRRDAPAGAAAT